jgi:hypothetical protein
MVAQYVEFLRNVCTARPEWRDKVRFPHLVRKNAFELKACAKALVKGNVFENVWQGGGQIGFAIVLTPRSQDGNSPWAGVTDVEMQHNVVRHCAGGVNILGTDNENPSQFAERIALSQMLFYDVSSAWGSGNGRLFQISAGARDVSIDHVTADKVGNSFLTLDGAADAAAGDHELDLAGRAVRHQRIGHGRRRRVVAGVHLTGQHVQRERDPHDDECAERQVSRRECEARRGVSAIGSDFKPAALNLPAGADIDAIKAELPVGAF